jgi:ABC-2 type transport system permease protein
MKGLVDVLFKQGFVAWIVLAVGIAPLLRYLLATQVAAVRKAARIACLPLMAIGLVYIAYYLVSTHRGGDPPWNPACLPNLAFALMVLGAIVAYALWFPRCWHVTVKELRTYFASPIAYAVMMAVFAISNLIFWWTLKDLMTRQGENVAMTTMTTCFLLVLISPLLTMRLLAEEKRSGTYEILMTRPIHDLQVVVGKFFGALGVMLVMIAVLFIQPLMAELGGNPDWGPIWSAHLGLIGWSAAFVAIGVFTSALTSSQIAAAAMSWFMLIVLWLLQALRSIDPGKPISKVGEYLSISGVMEEFARGTIDTTRLIYLASVTVFFLFAAWMTLFATRSR